MQESATKWSSMISSTSPAAVSVVMEDLKEGYIINIAREVDEVAVRIPNSISLKLKPHQVVFLSFFFSFALSLVLEICGYFVSSSMFLKFWILFFVAFWHKIHVGECNPVSKKSKIWR